MKIKAVVIAVFLCLVLFLAASCTKSPSTSKEVVAIAVELCKELCLEEKEKGTNLENGPCLTNTLVKDWVCDVAHSPRQPIDGNPDNQCSAFKEGKAHHFVEVDENCELIKYY